MRLVHTTVLVLLCVLSSQCSIRTMAIREVTDLVTDGVPAFERDDDLELVGNALPANIKLLEAMLESDPRNAKLLALLSQMYASYSFGFVEPALDQANIPNEDAVKTRVNRLYLRGIAYGERALILAAGACEKTIKVATQVDACFEAIDRDSVPALFWYGFNLAAYINRNLDNVGALGQGVFIEKAMQRVIALDEKYMFGSAHLLLMAYFGSRPPMMGGSAEKAKDHYDRIKELSKGAFKLADVYYARYVMVQQNNRASFEKLLKPLVNDKAESAGEAAGLRLYNAMAKSRAELYLKSIDEYF
jgi:hypothetical protein